MPGPFCGLVRFMGLSTRVESYRRDSPALPLGHSLPRLSGLVGSPSILSATPSRTCTRIPQPCRHMPQVLGIQLDSDGTVCATAMGTPTVIWRNFRLDGHIGSVTLITCSCDVRSRPRVVSIRTLAARDESQGWTVYERHHA